MPKRSISVTNKQLSELQSFLTSQYISEEDQIAKIKQFYRGIILDQQNWQQLDNYLTHIRKYYQTKIDKYINFFKFVLSYAITILDEIEEPFRGSFINEIDGMERGILRFNSYLKPQTKNNFLYYLQLVRDKYNLPPLQ